MGGVQFDAVVTGFDGATGGSLEQIDDIGDLLRRGRLRRPTGQIRRDNRRANRCHTVDLRAETVWSGMHDLRLNLRPVNVYRLDERPMRAHRVIGPRCRPPGVSGW